MEQKMFLEESTRFVVNTNNFRPRDYALFVESLETIWNIQRQQKKRLGNKRISSDCSGPDQIRRALLGDDAHSNMQSGAKTNMPENAKVDDENYFSGSSGNSPIVESRSSNKASANSTETLNISDSEDSGFYHVGPIYENVITFVRPRSALSATKSNLEKVDGTLRSRLIKMVRKHSMRQKRKEGERLFKFKTLSLRRKPKNQTDAKHKKKSNEADVNFLTKALNYLTF